MVPLFHFDSNILCDFFKKGTAVLFRSVRDFASLVNANVNDQHKRTRLNQTKNTRLVVDNSNRNHDDVTRRLEDANTAREKENNENQKSLKKIQREQTEMKDLMLGLRKVLSFNPSGVNPLPNEVCENVQSDDVSHMGQVSATTTSTTAESGKDHVIRELQYVVKDQGKTISSMTAPKRDPNAKRPEEQAMLDCTADSVGQHERRIRGSTRASRRAKNSGLWRA